ncbi:MAG: right-handed parallel beta-helix repeat-containing protein [Actinomycetota bacterium]|nr:right-handed parallel beta-helix repeat-containing protein [Actinomycetota bacterium]
MFSSHVRRRHHLGGATLLLLAALVAIVLALVLAAPSASAHEERPAEFPDGDGARPTYLGLDNPRHRVACRPDSERRIQAMPESPLRQRNLALLQECSSGSIQDAVDSISRRRTSVYVLPGVYTEDEYANREPSGYCANLASASDDPLATSQYIGSLTESAQADDGTNENTSPVAISYSDQVRCPHNLNLIAIFGDRSLSDDSIECDSRWCGTQIVGTGRRPGDVLIDNRFSKLNAVRADRAGGIVLRNFTVQRAEFNSVYVLETDGFLIDKVVARANDEYGILAFAGDHGLIQRVNAYYNGDSGIYPGSASDINADNTDLEVTRYAIEIRDSRSHHNALGYSGTAGNSVWAHHNDFYLNATGIATDSLFPNHPGLPQDHARWSHNRIHSNNVNYYEKFVQSGVCAQPMEERGYLTGTVCPVIPTPVGTGVLIAGGNYNSTDHNWIYDNWRFGTMQFWVPAPLREEYDPGKLYDTSNHNHTTHNHMGITPSGGKRPNGMDFWWDDQGVGNCWEDNTSSYGEPTHNFLVDPAPCSEGGSQWVPGAPVKDAGFLTCSQYNREDEFWRDPPACEWFEGPERPGSDSGPLPARSMATVAPVTSADGLGPGATAGVSGLALLAGLLVVVRRRVARSRVAVRAGTGQIRR